jgi:hypothetical protein
MLWACSTKDKNTDVVVTTDLNTANTWALVYNEMIIDIHTPVVDSYNTYITSLENSGSTIEQIKNNLAIILSSIDIANKQLDIMTWFAWDISFLAWTKAYLSGVRDIVLHQESQLIELKSSKWMIVTWDDEKKYFQIEEEIEKKLNIIDTNYKNIQETFAKRNNLQFDYNE